MERRGSHILFQNQCMKKNFCLGLLALMGVSLTMAQNSHKRPTPPPPPPPPVLTLNPVQPLPPSPPEPPSIQVISKEDHRFLQQHPEIQSMEWTDNKLRLHLKSGADESYQMDLREDQQKWATKYGGRLPVPPPPPPPPPTPQPVHFD